MKKTYLFLLLTIALSNSIKAQDMDDYREQLELAKADYGVRYTIGNYQLCPEKMLILEGRMFGTALKDNYGFFPEPALKYGEDTMVIFAGRAFFDDSGLGIDWQTVQLLSYQEHYSEFTDGVNLYYLRHGDPFKKNEKYDIGNYKPYAEEKPAKINSPDLKELAGRFCVRKGRFYNGNYPVLEPFDVPNLRTIVSENGFETDYITDGKQVMYGGFSGGVSLVKKLFREYVTVEDLLVSGIDFPTLRVLGKNMLSDKNAIYYRENVIPFDQLNGFKFIIREM